MEGIGKDIGKAIFIMCLFSVIVFWGGYELIDWLFVDHSIRSEYPITPKIELIVKDNVIDTIYVYHKPESK